MSESFTKVFAGILDSSVWFESDKTVRVWIAMLVMADPSGVVDASVLGLAQRANVSTTECEAALGVFLSPDKYSRTKDHDGRRIAELERGWLLLNYQAYREARSVEDRRSQNREAARRHRSKSCDATNQNVSNASATVSTRQQPSATSADASAESAQGEEEGEGEGEREERADAAAPAAPPAKAQKPTKREALDALNAALKAKLGANRPQLSNQQGQKAATRVFEHAQETGGDLATSAALLVASWLSLGHGRLPWKLLDDPFDRAKVPAAPSRYAPQSRSTTDRDFADAAPIADQLERIRGAKKYD